MKFFFALLTICTVYGQYAAPLLGDVAVTSVEGVEDDGDFGRQILPVGTNIFGPFEAGFSSVQDFVLAKLGCATGKGYLTGGIDTWTAEQAVATDCGVDLPRWEGNNYISLLGTCGGHTGDYHFHERLSCLYEQTGTHSTKVGDSLDGKNLYGKWENFETQEVPMLDACGGHWGETPDNGYSYHYHVQDTAPFTIGCFGPNPDNSLVTVEQCRALYDGCGDGDNVQLKTKYGTIEVDPWCPCYDAEGSTIGTKALSVFSFPDLAQGPGGQSVLQQPSTVPGYSLGGKMGGKGKKGKKGKKFGRKSGMGKFAKLQKLSKNGIKGKPTFALRLDSPTQNFYRISSATRANFCLDASAKKVGLKRCNSNHASQQFAVQDGVITYDGECISPTLTLGPCTARSLTAAVADNQGRFHNMIMGDRCVTTTKKLRLKARVCRVKARTQRFVIRSLR